MNTNILILILHLKIPFYVSGWGACTQNMLLLETFCFVTLLHVFWEVQMPDMVYLLRFFTVITVSVMIILGGYYHFLCCAGLSGSPV